MAGEWGRWMSKDECSEAEAKMLHVAGVNMNWIITNYAGELFTFVSHKIFLHMYQLSEQIKQSLLMRISPATVPTEIKRNMIPYTLDCSEMASPEVDTPDNAATLLTQFDSYTDPPPGLREIYQVHPVFVAKWAGERVKTLWQLYMINRDMVSYEVAALFLWWTVIPEHLYRFFARTKLHLVNLQEQSGPLSELLELCRQQGGCCSCDVGQEAFYWIRKYKNLAGRRRGTCDIALEKKRYHPAYSHRKWGSSGQPMSRRDYLLMFKEEAAKVTDKLIGNMRSNNLDTIKEWWKKRLNMVASGSSSNRHKLDPYIDKDPRISSSDRPNKKAVVETLGPDAFWEILHRMPHMIARRSTKNEPGLKQRALYAANDEAVIVSAYASHTVEKSMNFMGMCPLQRPVDVLRWWKAGQDRRGSEVWLSADFTDFNKEHSTAELSILNLCMAKSWIQKYHHSNIAREKAACALWVAMSQWNRYVKDEEGTLERVTSALFSGSRDTARDNTLLHQIYHNLICRWLDENLTGWGSVRHAFMCGDDEDVLFSSDIAAAAYYWCLQHLGWHANDSKQMSGYNDHEFLQKFPHPTKGCIAPISSMIVALCSGQWYTTPGLQQDNALAAMSDQLWELVVRGADIKKTYVLAIDLLNDYMQIKTEEGKKKLEWWKMRLQRQEIPNVYLEKASIIPNNNTTLWNYPNQHEESAVHPGTFYCVQECKVLPHKATQSWCDRWYPLFQEYGLTHLYPTYIKTVKAASYGSLYHTHIQQQKKKWLWNEWPERSSITQELYATAHRREAAHMQDQIMLFKNKELLFELLRKQSGKAGVENLNQKLAKVGADNIMFDLLGGYNNLELCNNLRVYSGQLREHPNWLMTYPQIQRCYMLLDPALRSFLTSTGPHNT